MVFGGVGAGRPHLVGALQRGLWLPGLPLQGLVPEVSQGGGGSSSSGARWAATASNVRVTPPSEEKLGLAFARAKGGSELWELLEYNTQYFNPHKMTPILEQVLEEAVTEVQEEPRLQAYLKHAATSSQLYENLKDLTTKDLAAAIVAAREINHTAADDLSDVIVNTVSAQLARLSPQRVSYFITSFAKQSVRDKVFWRAAAVAVTSSQENMTPQVVVSLLDAFRKSGLRQEKLFTSLTHRVYGVIEDLPASFIPPIVATICRVPLQSDERERAVRALLGRWLRTLRNEREHPTGAITVQQILSLTVSIGLVPAEELNTAIFARDVSAFIGNQFELLEMEDLIVFLWALQRLVPSGSLTEFFARGLLQVLKSWHSLQLSAQLSLQRLTQLSDVLVTVKTKAPREFSKGLNELQDLLLKDLTDSVQYSQCDSLADLLEIWAGNEAFWRQRVDFAEAVTKRFEELLLESKDLDEVLPLLRAVHAVPGLALSQSSSARRVLASAVNGRGTPDVERIHSVLAGGAWEQVLFNDISHTVPNSAADSVPSSSLNELLSTWERPRSDLELVDFLRAAHRHVRGAVDALRVLQAAAPLAQRLAADSSGEVLQRLESLGNEIVQDIESLSSADVAATLRACSVAGVPHAALAVAATSRLGVQAGAQTLVEVMEACAGLRLDLQEIKLWFERLLENGLDRRLPFGGLARLLAAAARMGLFDGHMRAIELILQRLVMVASPLRPPPVDAVAALCQGLYLARWTPKGPHFFDVVSWLATTDDSKKAPQQASAIRYFCFGVISSNEGREAVAGFSRQLQRSLAAPICYRAPRKPAGQPSDTTLKFRHEVAEVLRGARLPYDLDDVLVPGIGADLTLLSRDGSRGRGSQWLLDGPEAFRRPFIEQVLTPFGPASASRPQEDVPRVSLRLVPAEQRRAELIATLQDADECDEMRKAFHLWTAEDEALQSRQPEFLQVAQPANAPLARLSWLEWAAMTPVERLNVFRRPELRPAVSSSTGVVAE